MWTWLRVLYGERQWDGAGSVLRSPSLRYPQTSPPVIAPYRSARWREEIGITTPQNYPSAEETGTTDTANPVILILLIRYPSFYGSWLICAIFTCTPPPRFAYIMSQDGCFFARAVPALPDKSSGGGMGSGKEVSTARTVHTWSFFFMRRRNWYLHIPTEETSRN